MEPFRATLDVKMKSNRVILALLVLISTSSHTEEVNWYSGLELWQEIERISPETVKLSSIEIVSNEVRLRVYISPYNAEDGTPLSEFMRSIHNKLNVDISLNSYNDRIRTGLYEKSPPFGLSISIPTGANN